MHFGVRGKVVRARSWNECHRRLQLNLQCIASFNQFPDIMSQICFYSFRNVNNQRKHRTTHSTIRQSELFLIESSDLLGFHFTNCTTWIELKLDEICERPRSEIGSNKNPLKRSHHSTSNSSRTASTVRRHDASPSPEISLIHKNCI